MRVAVVRALLRNRRVPGSKPGFTEDPLCMWAWWKLNLTWVKCPPASVAK
ncbi:hypothetical protein AVEN_122598-1, partial [Araneus ventricosus]